VGLDGVAAGERQWVGSAYGEHISE
jgi:hypothetical protein